MEVLNEKEKPNEIKLILDQISSYYNNLSLKDTKNIITFECPKEKCPYIPLLKYYEYTQTISSICRNGHEYYISLSEFFQKILNNLKADKYCQGCMKKNIDKINPEFYCINCSFLLCKNCQMKHYRTHKILEYAKIDTLCPIHEKTKFSGYCRSCKKDLCIHCLKDHGNGHHSLVKYMTLVPNKEKIDKYKKQIRDEFNYIEKLKNILFEENILKDQNIKSILDIFFDRMKLKYYFYDIQLQTFDKFKFNISIIKNVTDLFLVRQQTFEGIYIPIQANFEEKKLEILNRILSIVLKYQITDIKNKINLKNIGNISYLTHFKFNHIYSLSTKKNIRFLYLLKNGKFLVCSDNDGLYLYDDSTYKELLHIPSEIDIIDLCENDTGLIFLLKKSMIEIIRLEENNMKYYIENKILFKTIDQVNFITCLKDGTIIVSRTKRTEGNLDIWMKSKINNLIENNNNNNNGGGNNNNNNDRRNTFGNDRRRNVLNLMNNNLRLGFMLRTARNNVNNFYQNNNLINNLGNNIGNIGNNLINNVVINQNNNNVNNRNNNNDDDDDDEDNDEDGDDNDENNDDNNNNNNNGNNNDQNNNNANNNNDIDIDEISNNENNNNNANSINNNSHNSNENILIQELPERVNITEGNNIDINTIPNNNNNNNIILTNLNRININNNNNNNLQNNNLNIIRPTNIVNMRHRGPRPRPRFVHVIRFIRDQLQGLVHNLEQEELVLEDPSLISSVGIYGSKDTEITHINKAVKKWCEIISLLDWDDDYFICAEFYIDKRYFRSVRIYSKENYEPISKKSKLKAKYCMKDKNCLLKITDNILGVCYIKDEIEYGISLIAFNTREEITRYELPKFNLAKNIAFNNNNYIFVFCRELINKNDDAIKVLKIEDKELIQSSNYFYEEFLNTYVYNHICNKENENEEKNKEEINNDIITDNYGQGEIIDEKEMNTVVSMVKLCNDTFVCLNRDNSINFYKVE